MDLKCHLGSLWDPLRGLLVAFGTLLGAFWEPFGSLEDRLGSLWGPLGSPLEPSWASLGFPEPGINLVGPLWHPKMLQI